MHHVFNGERNHSQKEVGLELAAAGEWKLDRCRQGKESEAPEQHMMWGYHASSAEVVSKGDISNLLAQGRSELEAG